MKFSCTQENLHNGLSLVSGIASKNSTLPILNNILFKVKNGSIDLSVTNLEIGVNYSIRGKIEEEGSFTLPAKILSDYISFLPKEKIDIELKDNQLFVQTTSSKTKIKGMDASEFPVIPQITLQNTISCPIDILSGALEQTLFASALNEARPEISGILFHKKTGSNILIIAATDSYRLAEKKITLTNIGDEEKEREITALIPYRTAQELLRIIGNFHRGFRLTEDEETESVSLAISENQILFHYDNLDMVSRLIEAKFPDYEQLVPKVWKTRAIVQTPELINAVKTSSLFARAGIFDVVLQMNHEGITVSSVNSQIGENISSLPAKTEGAESTIVLNYRYLLDGLLNIGSPEIMFEVTDQNTPCLIRTALKSESDVHDYFYLVMPIRQ